MCELPGYIHIPYLVDFGHPQGLTELPESLQLCLFSLSHINPHRTPIRQEP
jgi:hypothetical protein